MLGGLFYCLFVGYEKEDMEDIGKIKLNDEVTNEEKVEENVLKEEIKYVYVDIKGSVVKPGIYKMKEGDRVIDVIEASGGLKDEADTSVNNLSLKVFDEMVIVIYTKDEVKDFVKTLEREDQEQISCLDYNGLVNDSCVNSDVNIQDDVFPISINSASYEQLMKVPFIGEAKAKLIIEYREKNNGFTNIEQLKEIQGIKDATYEKIKDYFKL